MAGAKPFVHPEMQEGEVFLTNFFLGISHLEDIGWQTKRLGDVAYHNDGTAVPNARPVFVRRDELVAAGIDPGHLFEFPDLTGDEVDDDPRD